MALFRFQGFTRCKDSKPENGYDKIAIFGKEKEFTHIAKQQPDGVWTSKIGKMADLTHPDLDCLCGVEYGAVKVVMRRKLNEPVKE